MRAKRSWTRDEVTMNCANVSEIYFLLFILCRQLPLKRSLPQKVTLIFFMRLRKLKIKHLIAKHSTICLSSFFQGIYEPGKRHWLKVSEAKRPRFKICCSCGSYRIYFLLQQYSFFTYLNSITYQLSYMYLSSNAYEVVSFIAVLIKMES